MASAKHTRTLRILKRDGPHCCHCGHLILSVKGWHTSQFKGMDVSIFNEGTVEYCFTNAALSGSEHLMRVACVDCVQETGPLPWLNDGFEQSLSAKPLKLALQKDNGHCWLCNRPILPAWELRRLRDEGKLTELAGYRMATRDHYVPVSEGGKNGNYNMRAACYTCNKKRGIATNNGEDYRTWLPSDRVSVENGADGLETGYPDRILGAFSSVGQSAALIPSWSQVRVL